MFAVSVIVSGSTLSAHLENMKCPEQARLVTQPDIFFNIFTIIMHYCQIHIIFLVQQNEPIQRVVLCRYDPDPDRCNPELKLPRPRLGIS